MKSLSILGVPLGYGASMAGVDMGPAALRVARLNQRIARLGYVVRDLGDKNFLMLRNHGLLTVAETIPDAFLFMYIFQAACTIQIRAQAGGSNLITIDPRIIAGATAQAKQVTRGLGGALAWPALLRKLERIDPSYRT